MEYQSRNVQISCTVLALCFFPTSVGFGVFSHSKGLGATSSSGVSWGKFRRPRKRFCGGFPQHLCLPVLSVLLGPWGKFRWPRKRFSGFCGRFPQLFFAFVSQSSLPKRFCGRFSQLFFAFVSQSSLVMGKVPLTLLYICLASFSSKKVLVEGSPNFFPNSASFGIFSHSKAVLCSKSLSPPKRFFGVFPPKFFTFVSQSAAFFFRKWLLLQKRFRGGFRQLLFAFVSQVVKKALWRVPPTVLYIYLPVSSWGQSCVNNHSPKKTTQHVIAVGVFFGLKFSGY